MFCAKRSLTLGAALVGGGAAAVVGAFTVTRALDVALPPGPEAVIVYVVDVVGFTGVDPCGETFPTPGSIDKSTALVDDHESVTVPPEFTDSGEALIVTVG